MVAKPIVPTHKRRFAEGDLSGDGKADPDDVGQALTQRGDGDRRRDRGQHKRCDKGNTGEQTVEHRCDIAKGADSCEQADDNHGRSQFLDELVELHHSAPSAILIGIVLPPPPPPPLTP